MKSLRECASIAVTAFEVTRGRYIDDPDRRRRIARVQAVRLRALRDERMAAVDEAELIVRQAWLGVASCYESEQDAFCDMTRGRAA